MIAESKIDEILNSPFDYEWSIQGFGMLRTYLDTEHVQRLHIWDPQEAVIDVSTIHDHPWDFKSLVVRGTLQNQRYNVTPADDGNYESMQIVCGIGGHTIGNSVPTHVVGTPIETYVSGDTYNMEAPEFHESLPSRGAVTVIERKFHVERDIATVCYTGEWVSAEPRLATKDEITHFINLVKTA